VQIDFQYLLIDFPRLLISSHVKRGSNRRKFLKNFLSHLEWLECQFNYLFEMLRYNFVYIASTSFSTQTVAWKKCHYKWWKVKKPIIIFIRNWIVHQKAFYNWIPEDFSSLFLDALGLKSLISFFLLGDVNG
jgi:hypothetical protein